MSSEYRLWDRDSLYEEVWATPMATVAHRYGISGVGLAKICRKLAIPVPGRGYWAARDAGQAVAKIALPELKEPIPLLMPRPKPEVPPIEAYATPNESVRVDDLKARDPQELLKRGRMSHPLIAQAREVLGRAKPDDHEILWTRESCLDLRVSKALLSRALRFTAALISTLEAEGFKVTVGKGFREQTTATLYNQEIGFALLEKVDRIELVAPPKGGVLERVLAYGGKPYRYESSGRLSLQIWKPYSADQKNWGDRKTCTLEDLLPDIVAAFLRLALAGKAADEREAAERVEAERVATERAHKAELIKQEEARVRALLRAATNLERARRIRDLVARASESARNEGVSVEPGTTFGDWLIWAAQQADRFDPLKVSPPSIVDSKSAPEPQPSYYGYSKPARPMRFPKPLWGVVRE